jgi:hypothetical protein
MTSPGELTNHPEQHEHEDRRKFLAACGKFAVVTPPTITMLLSTSLNSTAIAHSGAGAVDGGKGDNGYGGGKGNNGWGNGGRDGSPNGKSDMGR